MTVRYEMRADVLEEWLTALRSGEYTQGTGYLHVRPETSGPDQFCCLGVLCDLAKTNGATFEVTKRPMPHGLTYDYDGMSGLLSGNVANSVGLVKNNDDPEEWYMPTRRDEWEPDTEVDIFIDLEGVGRDVSDLNDDGYTFEQIADLLEKVITPIPVEEPAHV